METLLKAITPFEIKEHDEEAMTFQGLASTWDLDLGGDVIHQGAFKRTLSHWRKSGKPLPLIDQHNYGSGTSVIGKLEEAEETDDGLLTTFSMLEGDPTSEAIYRRVREGLLDGLSIGYEPVKWEFEDDDESPIGRVRHLKELKLREISVVIWPMNEGARIDTETVKAMLRYAQDHELTADERKKLEQMQDEIGALLEASKPEPEGLAPEDPKRLLYEEKLRTLKLRGLGTR